MPSARINRLTVEMLGRQIFRCDIRNLLFNVDGEDRDPVCRTLVESVEQSKKRFYDDAETNVPKFGQKFDSEPAKPGEEGDVVVHPEDYECVCEEPETEVDSHECVWSVEECVCSGICVCGQQPQPLPPECVCSEPCVCTSPPKPQLTPEVSGTECICDEDCTCVTPPVSICESCRCLQEDVCTCVPPPIEVVVREDEPDTIVSSTDPCSCATPPPTSVESLLSCSELCVCGGEVLEDTEEEVCSCAEECVCGSPSGDEGGEKELACVCEEECSCEVCEDAPRFYRYMYG